MPKSKFGVIGLGVMGKSLSLNIMGKGIPLSVYNRNTPGEETIVSDFLEQNQLRKETFRDLRTWQGVCRIVGHTS